MHLSTLILLSASLASAQYGPSQEELEHLKNINSANNDQNQNQNQNQNNGQNYNPDYNGNYGNHDADYDNYDNYENLVPSPHTPLQAQAPSPTHSTFVVRPSQAFDAPHQAPAPGYQYNYPTPAVSRPLATRPVQQAPAPAPRHQPQHPGSNQDDWPRSHEPPFGSEGEDKFAGASGGIAPINPMKPGSQVAPPPLFPDSKYGKDEGNTFCAGKCFEEESEAKCAKPYSLAVYKPAKGCYMCCFTSDF
ncbi:hypothetical protein N7516_002802 [Penicillium verrucosum]|uniref:uncharacterized protein n=1 Tax=Penicillium verrucosum TaxID=60171 RepID=UPI002544FE09|nr:uncharacterized protein N7516_002802 [Penicillium verrucosum]KAJ5942634.1 hypothetical protein N7516_002802 [Penicillium verrucosum]